LQPAGFDLWRARPSFPVLNLPLMQSDSDATYGLSWMFVINEDTTWYAVDATGTVLASGNWTTPVAPGVRQPGQAMTKALTR
jgi:hypothetical protein